MYLKAKKPKKKTGKTQKATLITKVLLKNSNILRVFLICILLRIEIKSKNYYAKTMLNITYGI